MCVDTLIYESNQICIKCINIHSYKCRKYGLAHDFFFVCMGNFMIFLKLGVGLAIPSNVLYFCP